MTSLIIHELHSSNSEDELIDLSNEHQQAINGGKDCTYASQTYSEGAVVKMADGNYVCTGDTNGAWKPK